MTEDGFVRSHRLSDTEVRGTERVTVAERVTHDGVGSATVDAPDRDPDARNATQNGTTIVARLG